MASDTGRPIARKIAGLSSTPAVARLGIDGVCAGDDSRPNPKEEEVQPDGGKPVRSPNCRAANRLAGG